MQIICCHTNYGKVSNDGTLVGIEVVFPRITGDSINLVLFFRAECLIVVECPFQQVTIPCTGTASCITITVLSTRVTRVLPFAVVRVETALIHLQFSRQTVDNLELDITGTVEVIVAGFLVVLILILNRVTLVIIMVGSCKVRTILIINRINRKHIVSQDKVIGKRHLHIRQGSRTGQTDTQAVVDGTLLELEAEAVAGQRVVAGNTLTIHKSIRRTIVTLRCTTGKREGMLLRNTRPRHFIKPIGIIIIGIVERDVFAQRMVCIAPFLSIQQIRLVGNRRSRYIAIIIYRSLRTRTTLCRNQDDTAGSTRTVDSSGRSIFQDRDRFDIRRRNGGHITTGDTIDHNHRALVVLQRRSTTELDLRATGYIARTGNDIQTGYLTLQQVGSIAGNTFVEVFFSHVSHRTGNLAARLGTVTDSHDLAQVHNGRLELERDVVAPFDRFLDGVITNVRDLENRAFRVLHFERIITVNVGNRTVGGTFHQDVGTDNRFAVLIHYTTLDSRSLRKDSTCHAERHQHRGRQQPRMFERGKHLFLSHNCPFFTELT